MRDERWFQVSRIPQIYLSPAEIEEIAGGGKTAGLLSSRRLAGLNHLYVL